MRLIYIAGPYAAETAWRREQNVRRAEEAALAVWKLGAAAICPHSMCRYMDGELPVAAWMAGDLETLRRCDAVLLVGAWPLSPGATAEKREAEVRGLPVFDDVVKLERWIKAARGGAA